MPGKDPNHWLYRLDADEWLRAADNELRRAELMLEQKQQRPGVAGARRAAGMAWNAVLVLAPEDKYGRSYMEHLQALAEDTTVEEPVRAAARALIDAPLQTNIVMLGKGDTRLANCARIIVEAARERVTPRGEA